MKHLHGVCRLAAMAVAGLLAAAEPVKAECAGLYAWCQFYELVDGQPVTIRFDRSGGYHIEDAGRAIYCPPGSGCLAPVELGGLERTIEASGTLALLLDFMGSEGAGATPLRDWTRSGFGLDPARVIDVRALQEPLHSSIFGFEEPASSGLGQAFRQLGGDSLLLYLRAEFRFEDGSLNYSVSGPDHSTTFSLGQLVAAAMAAGARQGLIFLDAAGAQGAVDPALSQVLGDIPAGWSVVWLPPERSDSRLSNVDAVVLALTIVASGDGANPATFAGLRDALKIASQFGDRALLFTRSPDLAIGSGRQ